MTNEYELADDNRADLIYEKSDLLAPLLPGMEQPPHPMRLSDDEGDYYRQTWKRSASAETTGSDTGAGTGPGPDQRTGARDGLASQNTESVESDLPVETTEEGPL